MKELLERLIGLIPTYIDDLLALVGGPKRFVAARLSSNEPAMQRALVFLAVSFSIGWILKIPLTRGDALLELGPDGALTLTYILVYGVAIYAAWRIVGGRADIKKVLTIHFYYSGVLKLLQTSTYLVMMGALRAADPALYEELNKATYSGNIVGFLTNNSDRLLASWAFNLLLCVYIIGITTMLVWILVGWRAYRDLNQLSKSRSIMAGCLFFVFCFPVAALAFFITNALIG